jgi:hypothetical protein
MSRKTVSLLILLIITPVLIFLLWPSDENRIKKLFREGAKAIEREKIDAVMAKVSFNYTDDQGLTYLYLKEGMTRVFQRMEHITIEYDLTGITVEEKKATVELDVRVTARSGQDAGYIVGDAARPLHMRFLLDKERTTWLVIKTEGMPLNF